MGRVHFLPSPPHNFSFTPPLSFFASLHYPCFQQPSTSPLWTQALHQSDAVNRQLLSSGFTSGSCRYTLHASYKQQPAHLNLEYLRLPVLVWNSTTSFVLERFESCQFVGSPNTKNDAWVFCDYIMMHDILCSKDYFQLRIHVLTQSDRDRATRIPY